MDHLALGARAKEMRFKADSGCWLDQFRERNLLMSFDPHPRSGDEPSQWLLFRNSLG